MVAAELKRWFDEFGYVHLPAYFDTQLMDRVDRVCMDHFGLSPEWAHDDDFIRRSKAEIVPWFPQRNGTVEQAVIFDEVDCYPDFAELTEALIGKGWTNLYSMAMFSKMGSSGQSWHQDCPPEDGRRHNLNRLIYASPIRAEIGGEVVLMPGSHRRGVLPVGDVAEDMEGQLVLRPGKGDLLFLHGHCWHKVMPVHGGYRYSLNHRAAPPGTPDDITDICVYRNMRYRFSTSEVIEERHSG